MRLSPVLRAALLALLLTPGAAPALAAPDGAAGAKAPGPAAIMPLFALILAPGPAWKPGRPYAPPMVNPAALPPPR